MERRKIKTISELLGSEIVFFRSNLLRYFLFVGLWGGDDTKLGGGSLHAVDR